MVSDPKRTQTQLQIKYSLFICIYTESGTQPLDWFKLQKKLNVKSLIVLQGEKLHHTGQNNMNVWVQIVFVNHIQ